MGRYASRAIDAWQNLSARLRAIGDTLPPLILRLTMAWEYWQSGVEKYTGQNWFAEIKTHFPFPFNSIPTGISWGLSTGFENGAAALL